MKTEIEYPSGDFAATFQSSGVTLYNYDGCKKEYSTTLSRESAERLAADIQSYYSISLYEVLGILLIELGDDHPVLEQIQKRIAMKREGQE